MADGEIRVSVLPPDEQAEWSAFVRDSPFGSPYSLSEYQDALAASLGGSVRTVVARRGTTMVGGISVLEQSAPVGRFVAPGLLRYYNGFVLRDYDTRYPSQRAARQNEIVTKLAEDLVHQGYGQLVIRSRNPLVDVRPLVSAGWTATPSYTYVVLLDDLEALWGRVDQNLRRLVERGKAGGLELVVGGSFDAFYDLHEATGERKDAPVYLPRDAFRRFYDTLSAQGLCELFHARAADGAIVASQLVLLGHTVTHTVTAAADAARQNTGCNPFLRWSVFEWLAAGGYSANDLTDAMLAPVARFKSQLGGDLTLSFVTSRPSSATYTAQRAAQALVRRARSLAGGT